MGASTAVCSGSIGTGESVAVCGSDGGICGWERRMASNRWMRIKPGDIGSMHDDDGDSDGYATVSSKESLWTESIMQDDMTAGLAPCVRERHYIRNISTMK